MSAGVRYRVGERGPEDFIPSQSGRIDPNVSRGGGGVDAKALGRAVADALEGVKITVDGRQLGRLTVLASPGRSPWRSLAVAGRNARSHRSPDWN